MPLYLLYYIGTKAKRLNGELCPKSYVFCAFRESSFSRKAHELTAITTRAQLS